MEAMHDFSLLVRSTRPTREGCPHHKTLHRTTAQVMSEKEIIRVLEEENKRLKSDLEMVMSERDAFFSEKVHISFEKAAVVLLNSKIQVELQAAKRELIRVEQELDKLRRFSGLKGGGKRVVFGVEVET